MGSSNGICVCGGVVESELEVVDAVRRVPPSSSRRQTCDLRLRVTPAHVDALPEWRRGNTTRVDDAFKACRWLRRLGHRTNRLAMITGCTAQRERPRAMRPARQLKRLEAHRLLASRRMNGPATA
jgi:hypothetical protein